MARGARGNRVAGAAADTDAGTVTAGSSGVSGGDSRAAGSRGRLL